MDTTEAADNFYERVSRYAGDLYPGRYTRERCAEMIVLMNEIKKRAKEQHAFIVAHNYVYPEIQEVADMVGDSLGLAFYVRDAKAERVYFQSVYFMAEAAKMIVGDKTRVFVSDTPEKLGCSLVFGTDYRWIEKWKQENPDGVLITYINSSGYLKSISDYICTSRNAEKILLRAAEEYPKKKILLLPDKFLGFYMRACAIKKGVPEDLIDVYQYAKNGWHASCYVHEMIGDTALHDALDEHSDAELMIHPECGCQTACLPKLQSGRIPNAEAYVLSTEGMIQRARVSPKEKFLVATEKGLLYRQRKELPVKTFVPVSMNAECRYMKENVLEKLLESLKTGKREIVFCNDCCDPKKPHEDEEVIHIQRTVAEKSKKGIMNMLAIT